MDRPPSEISALLARHGQEHLWTFWSELSTKEQAELLDNLRSVDFDLVARLYRENGLGACAALAASPAQ